MEQPFWRTGYVEGGIGNFSPSLERFGCPP